MLAMVKLQQRKHHPGSRTRCNNRCWPTRCFGVMHPLETLWRSWCLTRVDTSARERDLEIDRLNTEAATNQDELSKVTAELTCLKTEKELVQRQDQQRLVSLASDLATVETAIHKKHEELTALSEKLNEAGAELRLRQAQVDELNDMKRKLQLAVSELEDTVRARESELQRLSSSVSQAELKLSRLEADVQASEQRIQNQNRLIAEDEAASVERRSDLKRLAQQLEEDKRQLELLARETGEQRTELDLLRAEKRRTLDTAAVSTRELTLKTENKQRELSSIQSSLNALLEERTQLEASVEALETERHQLRSEIQANHEEKNRDANIDAHPGNKIRAVPFIPAVAALRPRVTGYAWLDALSSMELKTSIGKQKRELEHLTEMGHLEDSRIRELKSEQRELLGQLEKLRAQNSELEACRTETEQAQSDMEKMQAQRNLFEVEVIQLRQERDLIRTQLERLQQKMKELKKQESELLESLSSAKLELARVRSDTELESTGLHQIQHRSVSSKNEIEKLSKQLEDNRAEVNRSQRLLLSVKSAAESHEKDLSEKRHQRAQLTGELNILSEAVQVGRKGKKAVDEEREASESALQNTIVQLNQATRDKSQMEQHLVAGRQNINAIDTELAQKSSQLDELHQQIQTSEVWTSAFQLTLSLPLRAMKWRKKAIVLNQTTPSTQFIAGMQQIFVDLLISRGYELRLAELEKSESKFTELGQALVQQGQREETPRNRTSARHPEQLDVNSELARTKLALASSQRECRRIKRRTARELAELERIAEDQCNRAGELAEQLTLVKRQYAQLRGQIASQTELSEHGKRLEAALAAVRSELDHNRCFENEAGAVLSEAACVTSNGCSQRTAPFGNGNQLNPSDEFTNDMHRSLFQLTNSFHNAYQPSCDQQSKSRSHFDMSRPSRNPSGLYKPDGTNHPPSMLVELGESTCPTGTTTVTSGLGSSMLNRTANSHEARHGVSHLNVPTQQGCLNRVETNKAELQRKFGELVAHQREQAASDWDNSGKKFRALRSQVDELREKLDRDGLCHGRSVKQRFMYTCVLKWSHNLVVLECICCLCCVTIFIDDDDDDDVLFSMFSARTETVNARRFSSAPNRACRR
ncbi:uncharacterized protein DEA37_0014763 [Paragonimus westermani]|uniref:Uncharacterized protein n=1 Tax=Paragonimus westermani TaxID=34504 RepID=A0A5J4NXQ7_9TREM|nr:uncharacterized protein DEA37_0014763 [Paragonimus westermani]